MRRDLALTRQALNAETLNAETFGDFKAALVDYANKAVRFAIWIVEAGALRMEIQGG